MKKLLALVLCVMLFVSVIPTSAFAAESKSGILYPAVQQANSLYGKLGQYGGQTLIKNLYEGFTKNYPVLVNNEDFHKEMKKIFDGIAKGGYSPKGLWNTKIDEKTIGTWITEFYGTAQKAFVGDFINVTDSTVLTADQKATITGQIANVELGITMPTFPEFSGTSSDQ